jgi:hypothetical protein
MIDLCTDRFSVVRPSTLHNIHTISPIEDEELEAEYLNMKVNHHNI